MQLAPLCHRLRNPRLPRCNVDGDGDDEEENDAHEHDDTMMMRMRTMLRR